ncbi:response regulator transcription factor [Paenibacillus whitsoniae]|uniref:Helix-turn-helix domain-containing protein n=1 Tax=Paenibacillus whitsoniae TaxID=2496558 RepID=A0A3S0CRC4_9BACL|nr:helix-turn-helix domain-containing protein [Paenibacillus whitsoniae]RTE05455.1 helix-turn-helix domain-containing protein [Paenibacillus whitsoniae]
MYNVMIVDDEPEIRKGIMMKVDWERLGLRIVGEAGNGSEALKALETACGAIDIVITDMNMPMMDGVSFLEACRERHPELRTLVLTGYEDFHYARAAVRSQVRDYLLKPVSKDELEEALQKVTRELDQERRQSQQQESMAWRLTQYYQEMKEHFVVQIVKEEREHAQAVRDRAKLFELEAWDALRVRILTIGLRERTAQPDCGERTPNKLRLPFELICKEFADQSEPPLLTFKDASYPGLLHLIVPEQGEVCQQLADKLRSLVVQYLSAEPAIGIGSPIEGFSSWREGYMSALLAWNLTETKGGASLKGEGAEPEALHEEAFQKPRMILLKGDMAAFQRTVRQELEKAFGVSQAYFVKIIFRLYLGIEAAAHESGVELDRKDELWMRPDLVLGFHTVERAEQFLVEMAQRIQRRTSEESGFQAVKQFIDSHYMYELNLTLLAERFNYYPSYFSELFKAKVGVTFIQYLNDVRMTHAVRLLEETALSLWDIAELTGFANASYFSSKFKKQYGLSPSEYRAQRKNEKSDSELPKK